MKVDESGYVEVIWKSFTCEIRQLDDKLNGEEYEEYVVEKISDPYLAHKYEDGTTDMNVHVVLFKEVESK